jgi:hypothetical protein
MFYLARNALLDLDETPADARITELAIFAAVCLSVLGAVGWRILTLYSRQDDIYFRWPTLWAFADILAAYLMTIYLFGIGYLEIHKWDRAAFAIAQGLKLDLVTAEYFSVVTISTTGFGDISPKSPLAMAAVSGEIILGYLFAVTLFSILAVLLADKIARRRPE